MPKSVANDARHKRQRVWRWTRRLAFGLVILCALAVAGLAFVLPAAAAIGCPACYGFEPLSHRVYVERNLPPDQRARIVRVLAAADARLVRVYGKVTSDPRVFICTNEPCYRRLGGGRDRGRAMLDLALVLSPRGLNPVIAAHELSHIELHQRVGRLRFLDGAIPAWFDEGFAVYVSDDPRYLRPAGIADRCRVRSTGPLPAGTRDWRRTAGTDHKLYAAAACRVNDWLQVHGGPDAVVALLRKIAAGESFAAAYSAH